MIRLKKTTKSVTFMILLVCLFLFPNVVIEAKEASAQKITYSKKIDEYGEYGDKLLAVQDAESGLWGYMNSYGTYKIKPKYYNAYGFSSGLAAVQNADGKYIFINSKGKQAFEGSYDEIFPRFKEQNHCFLLGYAHVRVGDNCFLIDKDGKQIGESYPVASAEVDLRKNSVLMGDVMLSVTDGVSSVINTTYDKLFTGVGYLYGNYFRELDKHIIYDKNGKYVIDVQELADKEGLTLDYTILNPGYIIFKNNVNGLHTECMYNLQGKKIFDFKYKNIVPINDKYFIIKNNAGNVGIVNSTGKTIASTKYSSYGLTTALDTNETVVILEKDKTSYRFDLSTGKLKKMTTYLSSTSYASKNCFYYDTQTNLAVFSANGTPLNLIIDIRGTSKQNLKAMLKDEFFVCYKSKNDDQLYLAYLK